MSSSSKPAHQIKIDNLIINKHLINSLIPQSQNRSPQITITQVFRLYDKVQQFQQTKNPDNNLKIQIKSIVQNRLTNHQYQKDFQKKYKHYKLDFQKVYPLNKQGNFGRVLERRCRLVPKGVMQYQDNKQAKLKQVKDFVNRIQFIQNKDLIDLGWITQQPQKYKFRIIMLDVNQNKKGVYFQTYQESQNVRAYFCSKYKKKECNYQVFGSLKYMLLQKYMQSFVHKIKMRNINKRIQQNQMNIANKLKNQGQVNFSMEKSNKLNNSSQMGQRKNTNSFLNRSNFLDKSSINEKNMNKSSFVNKREDYQSGGDRKQDSSANIKNTSGFLDDIISKHNQRNPFATYLNKGDDKGLDIEAYTSRNTVEANNRLKMFNQLSIQHMFRAWRDCAAKKSNYHNSRSRGGVNQSNISRSKFYDPQDSIEDDNFMNIGSRMLVTKQNTHTTRKVQTLKSNNNKDQSLESKQISRKLFEQSQSRTPYQKQFNPTGGRNFNINDTSPIKQSSRVNRVMGHSRKQQSIFTYPQKIEEEEDMLRQSQKGNKIIKKLGTQKIVFKSIEFLQNNNQNDIDKQNTQSKPVTNPLLIKPIITITAFKRDPQQKQQKNNSKTANKNNKEEKAYRSRMQQKKGQFVFNTIIKKVFRTSQYELLPTQKQHVLETAQNLKNFYLVVSVINLLTNEEINQTQIAFKDFCFSTHINSIVDKRSTIRIKFQYKNTGVAAPQVIYKNNQYSESSLFFSFPKIDPQIILKIKTFWQTQAVSNSYYNLQDNFNIFDAVSNSSNEAQPLTWWINLDEAEYNYLCILQSSSIILGYKLVKPMLFLIRAVKNINFKIQKIIQMLLSIIINLGKFYYFPEEINKINYLHRQIGLSKGKIQFPNRVYLETLLFNKFLTIQCKQLHENFQRQNICISHLMLQYTYQLFTRNFEIQVLCDFWNYCSQEMIKVPFIFFLTTISLCRLMHEKLIECKRLSHVKEVFQSKQIKSSVVLLNDIKYLKQKYFFKGEGLIEQIKQAFQSRPYQNILNIYYKKLQQKDTFQKKQKYKYKKQLCAKVYQHVTFEEAMTLFTKPHLPKKHILHLYFYQLPQFGGKLILASGTNEYESISTEKNKYFIIGEISSPVYLKYTDFKGNLFTGELIFNQGFNQFKIKIFCAKKGQQAGVHYICGLLTQKQIQIIKNNKKYNHFLGPNIQKTYFQQQLLKPLKQYKGYSNQQDFISQQWFKDLKNLFSYGNKFFNQIEYFLFLIEQQTITYEQKLQKIRQYSLQLSKQFFLCHNEIIYKHLLKQFFTISFLGLKDNQFQCYFNDALANEFSAPKILKCRLFYNNKQVHLQKEIIDYHSKKSCRNLYGDLFVEEIMSVCESYIKAKLGSNLTEGEVKLLYSTFGEVKLKVIPIKFENKQLIVDYSRMVQTNSIFHEISQKQPQILMTEILPSFSKISTILDYVNSSRNIDLRSKLNQQERKVIPEGINLLKHVQNKFKDCLMLRYDKYPVNIQIPFFSYFYELTQEVVKPKFKYYYLNNVKQSVKSICICKDHLKFSSNNKQQDQEFDKNVGLFGNLRKIRLLNQKANSVFFWIDHKQQNTIPLSLACINYGYGVVRWQKCIIRKYRKKAKQRINRKSTIQNNAKKKTEYLVEHNNTKYFAREYQVRLNPLAKQILEEHEEEYENRIAELDTDIKQGFSFLLNPANLQKFVRSVKNK